MTVEAIKEEIGHLSDHERKQLFAWLEELAEQAWDREMERDFGPGGRGGNLLERIDGEIAAREAVPLQEDLRLSGSHDDRMLSG